MGGVISQLGMGEGGGSTGESGQKFTGGQANLQMPVDVAQAVGAHAATSNALDQQQAFVNALAAQNGIGNQSNIYNQLGGVAAGTGPNPAMAALNQATSANTANQAALMAGQRGAGANTGLIARQAAMQGAANQQAALGQGATMQAQQSLNAIGMQGGIAGQQVGQQAAANQAMLAGTQNEQQMLLNAIAAQNQSATGSQASVNQANSGVADIVAKKQSEGIAGIGGGGGLFGMGNAHGGVIESYAAGGQVAPPAAQTAPGAVQPPQSSFVQYLQSLGSQPQKNQQQQQTGGALGNIQSAYKFGKHVYDMLKPKTMELQEGDVAAPGESATPLGPQNNPELTPGDVPANSVSEAPYGPINTGGGDAANPLSSIFGGGADAAAAGEAAEVGEAADLGYMGELGEVAAIAAHGGVMGRSSAKKVPAIVSPGEIYLPPKQAQAVAAKKASPMEGEKIPGKAKFKGDDYRNDTVPRVLEAGGVVIPKSIMESPDAAKKAAAFVTAHLAKSGRLPKKPS